MVNYALAPLLNGGARVRPGNQSKVHQWKENTLYLFTPTPICHLYVLCLYYVLSPNCIVFVVGLLQSNLHDHLVREVKVKVQVYSLISSLKTYHATLHPTPWSLDLFIRVPSQLHGEHTVL